MSGFRKAERSRAKLRIALTGPSGSGKTFSALILMSTLARLQGGKFAVIDTENESASLYADRFDFEVLDLKSPYEPERFIEAHALAVKNGYCGLIIDSLTHEWSGPGGCLELVDTIAAARYRGNSWSAFNEVTPRHRALLDTLISSPLHIIATLRSKTETAQSENDKGKKTVVKLGMKSEMRDGFEYEMTTVLDIIHEGHFATASKDRTGLFTGKTPAKISEETGEMLWSWLNSGKELKPRERDEKGFEPPRQEASKQTQTAKPPESKPTPEQQEETYHKVRAAIDAATDPEVINGYIPAIDRRFKQGLLTAEQVGKLYAAGDTRISELKTTTATAEP